MTKDLNRDWITIPEAARILDLRPGTLYAYIYRKQVIPAAAVQKVGTGWLIRADWIKKRIEQKEKKTMIYKKYKVDLTDHAYHFAQYEVGSLREVLQGTADIWYSRDDCEWYTLRTEVVRFYDDLVDALQNLEELKNVLTGVYRHLYKDEAAQMVSDWIVGHFYYAIDDAAELVRRFAHWKDARAAFISMLQQDAPEDVEQLEDFQRAV